MKHKIHPIQRPGPIFFAFLAPMVLYLLVMAITEQPPFGDKALLISDCTHQYYPFFLELRRAIRAGESLQWTWAIGMGTSHIGLIAYYTASPLNLLSVLLPESWLAAYFCLLSPLKMALGSASLAYLLKKIHGKSDWALVLFGCLYAFCSWSTYYFWNVMWLDGLALLPLTVWGTIRLLRDRKHLVYVLSIAATLIINYYVAIFICTFVLLLFICYEFCRWRNLKVLALDFTRIALFTVLAFCLGAIMLAPAADTLLRSTEFYGHNIEIFSTSIISVEEQASAVAAWDDYKSFRALGDPAAKYLIAALKESIPLFYKTLAVIINSTTIPTYTDATMLDPAPPIYFGVCALVLVFLSLVSDKKATREKLAYIFLVGFYLLGLVFNNISFIYHGFHYPAQLPFRFSFVLCFVGICAAYDTWLHHDEVETWRIPVAGVLTAGFLFLSNVFKDNTQRNNTLEIIFIFTATLTLTSYFGKKVKAWTELQNQQPHVKKPKKKKVQTSASKRFSLLPHQQDRIGHIATKIVMVIAIVTEIVSAPARSGNYYKNYDTNIPELDAKRSAIVQMQDELSDTEPFYRTELSEASTLNDGALYGFNSPSIFSSTDNNATTNFLISMGADCTIINNRTYHGINSPVTMLFTGVKYIFCTTDAAAYNPHLEQVDVEMIGGKEDKKLKLYRNTAYLPLGFMVDDALLDLPFEGEQTQGSFNFQNQLFTAATGIEEPVYTIVPDEDWTAVADKDFTSIEKVGPSYILKNSSSEEDGYPAVEFTASKSGTLVVFLDASNLSYVVNQNNAQLFTGLIQDDCQMIAISDVKAGDKISIQIFCGMKAEDAEDTTVEFGIDAAIMDNDLFLQGYEQLNRSTLQLTNATNTKLSGTISCPEGGILYTSIPQDGYWTAYVDGEKVETSKIGNAMLCLNLTAGEHAVEFRYCNKAFVVGCCISGISIVTLIAIHIIQKKKQKKPDGENAAPASSKE